MSFTIAKISVGIEQFILLAEVGVVWLSRTAPGLHAALN